MTKLTRQIDAYHDWLAFAQSKGWELVSFESYVIYWEENNELLE